MKIAIACDHGGVQLKDYIVSYLKKLQHDVIDCGTNSTQSCDYPDFAYKAAKLVADGQCPFGIVVCTTGIGVSIVANKVKGIRCALCQNADMADLTRRHNNANMLALGARYIDEKTAKEIIDTFLSSQFEGGRHSLRVDKIAEVEREEL